MTSTADRRDVLPIPDRPYTGLVTYDAKDPATSFPPIQQTRPPGDAPNIVVVLLDDVGFGASSTFGGPCDTPTGDRLAERGLRYNRMHTTALCSPTRQALLTGRNHHSVGFGSITELATAAPGYNAIRPNTAATIAEILRLNGYSTAQFGKCHEVPPWEASPIGPFDRWPTGMGFERFYGFVGGDTHQYAPALYDGTTPIEAPDDPDYHLSEDLAAKTVSWMRQQKTFAPDKPFFVYFAPGATHAPHHVPKQWIDKYAGKFDDGWDALREATLARQQQLGVVPADAELSAPNPEIPAWDDMPDELKPVLARQMEVYAAFLEHTDAQVGKVVDGLEELGIMDDTLFVYVIGDNGASAEGTPQGTFNEMIPLNGFNDLETPEFMASHIDDFGGPDSYNHFAVGWAHAMCTPFQWTKQVASHFGGTRNGTVVHWPNGIEAAGELREQFHHIIDLAPTILEAAGLPEPTSVHGVQQKPMEGVSLAYTFDDPDAPDRHTTQYFEMFGNRGIYHEGWTAVTKHRTPWLLGAVELPAFDDDVWELYDTRTDWSQAHDLSAEHPDKLHELQRLWLIEAVKYNVLPIDDRTAERFNPEIAGRPDLMAGRSSMRLDGHSQRISENAAPNTKNKSFAVTAELVVPDGGAEGVIVTQGGAFGGWSLYAKDGAATYCYNFIGLDRSYVAADAPLAPGSHQVRIEFRYDGGGAGKGADLVLFVDGDEVGVGRTERSIPYLISLDETLDVGTDAGTPVTDQYPARENEFNGRIEWVQVDLEPDDHSHLVDPEAILHARMVKQ
ncbi:arylsulfatase [Ilumatobacter sp.]|uniref:arylsulfatase n=1 Tax=Ilumatobacter sp. TaxID=1967498 RepID=UPI003AF669AD